MMKCFKVEEKYISDSGSSISFCMLGVNYEHSFWVSLTASFFYGCTVWPVKANFTYHLYWADLLHKSLSRWKYKVALPVVKVASLPNFESSRIRFSSILSNDKCNTRFGSVRVIVGENVGVGCFNACVTPGRFEG